MRLENFEPLFIAMNQVGEKKQRFTIEYNGVRAHVLFLADVEPFLLIFGIQGTNEYFELEMNQDFEVNSFFAKELYRKLIEIFNIQYDPDHKFTPNDFLSFGFESISWTHFSRDGYVIFSFAKSSNS
ncbi:DUF6037 family protein [Enterococcus montenegrensis]|uniref:DUF6037 family protein n=1 Tax=Enterococcus montenegrensis TaxID=3031993 RepID=UPI00249F76F1|nr:DUF6037 family protein [Enterococcus montenegrensis]WHA08745.1 DUF6037 family protein [Enterococcus montenegrensis]